MSTAPASSRGPVADDGDPAAAVEAEALGLTLGASCARIERLRFADGRPMAHDGEQRRWSEPAIEPQTELLEVAPGAPLLVLQRSTDARMTPIEYTTFWYRGDRYLLSGSQRSRRVRGDPATARIGAAICSPEGAAPAGAPSV